MNPRTTGSRVLHHCLTALAWTVIIPVITVLVSIAAVSATIVALLFTAVIVGAVGASPASWPQVADWAIACLCGSVAVWLLIVQPVAVRTHRRSNRRRTV